MDCLICRNGQTKPSTTTITLERGQSTLVFKAVPALICENCGEVYVDGQVSASLFEMAEAALKAGVVLEVRDFAAA